jgi:hypothetical protein
MSAVSRVEFVSDRVSYTEWFRALVQYLEAVGEIIWSRKYKSLCSFVTVSEWRCFYTNVILFYCHRFTGNAHSLFTEVEIFEMQLSDWDSSTYNKNSCINKIAYIYSCVVCRYASREWFLRWKFSRCIEEISASISWSETTLPTCIWNGTS